MSYFLYDINLLIWRYLSVLHKAGLAALCSDGRNRIWQNMRTSEPRPSQTLKEGGAPQCRTTRMPCEPR